MKPSLKSFLCVVFSLVLIVAFAPDLSAKRYGGSFKFSSAKNYRTPAWGGSTRKAAAPRPVKPAAPQPPKGVNTATAQSRLRSAPTNHFSSQRQQNAYRTYQSNQRAKFTGKASAAPSAGANVKNSPLYRRAGNSAPMRSGDYWQRRDRFYGGWTGPSYIYMGAPRYGMWDSMFLWFMLSNVHSPGYGSFAHHHRNDPAVQEWMAEAEQLSTENAEIREQLDVLKAEMAALEGRPVDRGYLPPGVDTDMVLAPDVVATLTPTFRLCTADSQGNYQRFGTFVKEAAEGSVSVELVNTAGSMANLALLESDRCDGAYVQRNAFPAYAERNPTGSFNFERVVSPALEYAHMVCHRDSGVEAVGDLPGKTLLVGAKGSGTEVTWSDFVSMDSRYARVETDFVGGVAALNQVVLKQADCLLYVASLNTRLMQWANSMGDKLVMVPVNDWDPSSKRYSDGSLFKGHKDQSGEQVYLSRDIPGGQYDNIQDGIIWSSVETLAVPVDMVASLSWSETYPDAYNGFIKAVMSTRASVRRAVDPN